MTVRHPEFAYARTLLAGSRFQGHTPARKSGRPCCGYEQRSGSRRSTDNLARKHTKEGKGVPDSLTLKTPAKASKRAPFAQSACLKYAKQLHRYLIRRLARPQDAEDLVQEVYMRLLRVDRGDFIRNPEAYVFGVAFHVVREFQLKARNERRHLDFDSGAVEELSNSLSRDLPDQLAERLNIERQLERAFAQLPPAHRAILLLIKRDGMSYEEAARKTNFSVHTVEKYLFEALAQMRTAKWDR